MDVPAERARPSADRARPLQELAGGLGDAGLLVPLMVAMVALNGIGATAAFGLAGLAYIGTALAFRVPVPVQPLKAFAAAAVALGLEADVIAAGALLMSGAMAVLAVTGLAGWLAERFPQVLVRGIQAAVALLLVKAAVDLAGKGNWSGMPEIAPALAFAMAGAACLVLFLARTSWQLPGSLAVLGGGFAIGLAVGGFPDDLTLGPGPVDLSVPDGPAFGEALTALVLAQLPLTFGNSIVATADAERTYFGEGARRVTPNRLAASIGLWNALAGLFTAVPVCHGAGGVTAHYKLGARSAFSTASAGALLLALALLLGDSLPALLRVLAPGALAGMLLFVAVQHGLLALSIRGAFERTVVITVGAVTLIAGNLAVGFAVGVAILVLRSLRTRARTATPAPA
jgi:MFS superfamily sulfate permease-like transporter